MEREDLLLTNRLWILWLEGKGQISRKDYLNLIGVSQSDDTTYKKIIKCLVDNAVGYDELAMKSGNGFEPKEKVIIYDLEKLFNYLWDMDSWKLTRRVLKRYGVTLHKKFYY